VVANMLPSSVKMQPVVSHWPGVGVVGCCT
jgi:hypothetical protein